MEKLLKENSAVRTAETFVAGAAAMKLLEVGCIPLMVGVVAFIATTIWIVKSIKSGKGNLTRKAKVLMVALATVSTISLIYGVYHKLNCHNLNVAEEATNEVVTEDTTDTKENKPEEVAEPTEEVDSKLEAEASNAGKVVVKRGFCPTEDKIQVTYGNIGEGNEQKPNTTETETKVTDPSKETVHIKAEDKNEGSDGIVSETGKTTTKKDEEAKKDSDEPKATMDKDNAVQTKSEESKKEEPKEEKAEEAKKSEEVVKATDDELDNMLKATETVETTPEMEVVEIDSKAEEPAQKNEEVVEEKPEEKAIEVEAIDGYAGNINSTMQFKISGTNVKVDGLDGIDYTFSNGYLNINTGDESTVLTVEVSNSVSTVSFDIVINGVLN